jgi:hypothetical protein
MMLKRITTPAEAFDAVGGTAAAAEIVARSKAWVSNRRKLNRLPAHAFHGLYPALIQAGYDPDLLIWEAIPSEYVVVVELAVKT